MLKRIGSEMSTVPIEADAIQYGHETEMGDILAAHITAYVELCEATTDRGLKEWKEVRDLSHEAFFVDVTTGGYESELEPVVRWRKAFGYGTIQFTATHKRTYREADRSIVEFAIEAEVA